MKTDKLNRIYQQHKDKFSHGFHTTLWQIIVNQVVNRRAKKTAFAYVINNGLQTIGLVNLGVGGYTPLPPSFAHGLTETQCREVITELNKSVFNLEPFEAEEIEDSSYATQLGI